MRKILVTGGTVFASKFVAEYFVNLGDEVFVLNRNTKPQPNGVILIQGDRHALGDQLKQHDFDVVVDVTSYTKEDVKNLLDALGGFEQYIMISSSAVYPETELLERVPDAYILRPPYLYGEMNNVYRSINEMCCLLD